MTKVLLRSFSGGLLAGCLLSALAQAQPSPTATCPQTTAALYSRIGSVGLDAGRVYQVRGAAIDRPNLHLDFDDGTLAFTEDICGRITGAYFEGAGEIRLRPPNRVERESMALFTGMAILDEQFSSAYLRFNDDTAAVLQPFLSATEGGEFAKQGNGVSQSLAAQDARRLLLDFSHFLPTTQGKEPAWEFPPLLHAHLLGQKLGAFEVYWDAANPEPLWAGQTRARNDVLFFDTWTSFVPSGAVGKHRRAAIVNDVSAIAFRIRASVQPPRRLQASTEVDVRVHGGGQRTLVFELSRYLKVDHIDDQGTPVDFLQNQALEGTQLERKGNDLVALVFPAPLTAGQLLKLHFTYAGDVLSEAGAGLLYVGERGTWYPNFGLNPAQFDLEFRYPAVWTLIATGKRISGAGDEDESEEAAGEKVSHWVSERPIAVAGFNLGRYVRAEAKAGTVSVAAYGTKGVERSFPKAPAEMVPPPTFPGPEGLRGMKSGPIMVIPPPAPSPARNVQAVAERASKAIESFSSWFGPYPYGSLALTQMPGNLSQGWPGLVFLSSFAFLSPQEQADLKLDPVARVLDSQALVHETAHQWWGDLVLWKSYRDQWFVEGLASYCALLVLEKSNPAQFRLVLEKYRRDLLSKNKEGELLRTAGPVTLGQRLISSHFPGGYEAISYERGAWLFHMLRSMLRDSEGATRSRDRKANPEEPFFRALRRVRERYAGKSVSTKELMQVFEEELPRPLWYENRHTLDWFVEGWINGTAIPQLETRDVRISPKEGKAIVSGVIVQKDAPQDLVTAVPVYTITKGNSLVFLGQVLADGEETGFRLSAPSDARKVVLDPKQTILSAPK